MKTIEGKRVLITGGAGFIGSTFTEQTVKAGCNVMVYDNLSSGNYDFIRHLEGKNLTFVKGDLLDFDKLDAQFKKHKPEVVVHLAANPDVMKGLSNTKLDLEQGTMATYNVLEASRRSDIDDIFFSSSSVIYGDSKVKPTPEEYGPVTPISLYGASKLAGEGLITSFSHLFGFDYYIYRFANVAGKSLTHGVIHKLICKLNNGNNLELLSDGTPKKGYLDVEDCVNAMLLVYNKSAEKENIYNISLKDQISVREIAELVVKRFSPKRR